MAEEIIERLSALEVRVDEHGKKLVKQQEKNESQIELNMLIKMAVESSKEHAKQMVKFGETLDRVNDNLSNLNSRMHDLNQRVTEIEDNQEDRKIDLGKLFKDLVFKVLPAIVIAWVLFETGWK